MGRNFPPVVLGQEGDFGAGLGGHGMKGGQELSPEPAHTLFKWMCLQQACGIQQASNGTAGNTTRMQTAATIQSLSGVPTVAYGITHLTDLNQMLI